MSLLDFQPLEFGRMQECGSALLKALQNDSMVPLDLLVREAVQNSLDASAGMSKVSVAFDITRHDPEAVASILDGPVSIRIREAYQGRGLHRLLVIRDTWTVGLTGPLSIDDIPADGPHGNFVKLVYEVGRSQESFEKGGSWGLGKTVYYRVGSGLVFFYSRVRLEGGDYQERLACCLIEDERRTDRLLLNSRTGIAWWGRGRVAPLIDGAAIRSILERLGVAPFSAEETGTAVVIPFLRNDLGPPIVQDGDDPGTDEGSSAASPWWHRSYEEYLRVAVQKWYGIRLNNRRFKGPALEVRINGSTIGEEQILPIFRLAKNLYLGCFSDRKTYPFEAENGEVVEARVEEMAPLRVAFEGTQSAGRVAVALVTREQLGMARPHNHPSPHEVLTGLTQVARTTPLVAFLRGHGMIIRWDDRADGYGWAKGLNALPEGKYLIAVVVPQGNVPLHSRVRSVLRITPPPTTLEGYLRSCEKADHHQWSDHVGVTIVKRMRDRVAQALKGVVPLPAHIPDVTTPYLAARTIADKLLPEGFGTDSRSMPRASSSPPAVSPRRLGNVALPRLEVDSVSYRSGGVSIGWRLVWGNRPVPCILKILVDTELRPLSRESWENNQNGEGLGRFPLSLEGVTSETVQQVGAEDQVWDVAVTPLGDVPGVRFVPKGRNLKRGLIFQLRGVIDVGVGSSSERPIQALLVVESCSDLTS